MTIARTALNHPRTFALGLAAGVALIAAGFLLAVVATGQVGAASPGATAPACVNLYTGDVRMGVPGQTLTCGQGEVLIELSTGHAANNLSYAVRTVEDDVSTVSFFGSLRTVDCAPGETALNGGSRLMSGGGYVNSTTFDSGAGGPIGSPPTGWMSGFEYTSGGHRSNHVVETWVLCVS